MFEPDRSLTEPVIWIQRLLIFDEHAPGVEPRRDVPFRRGLNIIATEIPGPEVTVPVGHDVGKTLLTRLIRYCLGEPTYAKTAVRAAIEREFPEGVVIAEIFVGGELWTVLRPLVLERRSKSTAWRGTDWKGVAHGATESTYSQFLERLEQLTALKFAGLMLPGQKRKPVWRDVLAWLSRDQHCAYRDPLEWRSPWAESGSSELNAEDASLVVRMAMDLADEDEGELIQRRKSLIEKKREEVKQYRENKTALEQQRTFLLAHLKVGQELLDGDLFGSTAVRELEQEIAEAKADIDGLPRTSGLLQLAKVRKSAAKAVRSTQAAIRLRTKDRKNEETQLDRNRTATGDDLLEQLGDLASGCPASYSECPLYEENEQVRERELYRAALVESSTRRLAELDQSLAQLREQIRPERVQLKKSRSAHHELALTVKKELRSKRQVLARLEAIHSAAEAYAPAREELHKLGRAIKRIQKRLDTLKTQQREFAERNTKKLRRLNESIQAVQRRILGRDAAPSLRIGINRLTFTGNNEEPAPGEGMATSATLSLDLGCLRASLTGLGFLPRLLIHDSPRGGDLEAHLYAQLFQLAIDLERAFDPVPFQYILATTTHPPDELLKPPYLKLMLDARDPDKLLLKKRF